MERFLQRHRHRRLGSIAGFERFLFRGILRSIFYVEGLNYFMGNQRVPFKRFQAFVGEFSARVKARAQRIAERAGRPFLHVASGQADKEKRVREVMERDPGRGKPPALRRILGHQRPWGEWTESRAFMIW